MAENFSALVRKDLEPEFCTDLELEPTRHCSACGIGPAEPGSSECGRCGTSKAKLVQDGSDAIAVLEQYKHRGREQWHYDRRFGDDSVWSDSPLGTPDYNLTEFEAIAIAEKYLREGNGGD
jgi:hypothetical protein